MRLLEALRSCSEVLASSGVEDALADAELIVLHTSGIDRLHAYIDNPELMRNELAAVRQLTRRRAQGVPIQYLIGSVDFLGLNITIGKGVLIPRPETELLVEEAIRVCKVMETFGKIPEVLDLCTGSGCIALAVAREFPKVLVYASDISKKALNYAKKNAELNRIRNVRFLNGSLFQPITKNLYFDLIVSNPPYIRTEEINKLQREVRDWEPHTALDGGVDGLDFYRKIFAGAKQHLKKEGRIIVELGFSQAAEVKKLANQSGFSRISLIRDYADIERVLNAGE